MIFRKNITPLCAYCMYGSAVDNDHILCSKKGVVLSDCKCRRFKYDAVKRIPPRRAVKERKFSDDDFSIE